MNNLEDKCVWKVMSEDKNSTTFQAVYEGHKLYDCIQCSGKLGSCPNYSSSNKLKQKYDLRKL